MKQVSEEIRLRHYYRKLILQGKLSLSREATLRLIGPDCAYRLYALGTASKRRRHPSRLTR